jgi:hypothetical protein
LEMYDQVVRDYPGGAMRVYLEREFIPNEEFVCKRLGGEAQRIIQVCRMKMSAEEVQHSSSNNKLVCSVQSFLSSIRENFLKIFLGMEDYRALKLGQFRLGGEVHQWMYDHYSLTKLLSKVGFNNLKPVGPAESQIPHWSAYSLDTETDGTVYKPDSLYIEAKRCADRPS